MTQRAPNYPPPGRNPHCILCNGDPAKVRVCRYGHVEQCHYPYTCDAAACSHHVSDDLDEVREDHADWIRSGQCPYYDASVLPS